jgi:hypothetical protein
MENPKWKSGDRNRKCYCGSGIKYKFCHYLIEKGEQPFRIKDKKGFIVKNPKRK